MAPLMPPIESLQTVRNHTDKRLILRLRVYLGVSVALAAFVTYSAIAHRVSAFLVVPGIIIGALVGTVISRMYKISWDSGADKVIGKIDIYGFIVLACYIVLEIFRSKIVSRFVSGDAVSVVSFAVLSGIMYGRVLGMHGNIRRVLTEQKIF